MTFSTMFGSVANCVINVNVGGQAPTIEHFDCILCTLYCYSIFCSCENFLKNEFFDCYVSIARTPTAVYANELTYS